MIRSSHPSPSISNQLTPGPSELSLFGSSGCRAKSSNSSCECECAISLDISWNNCFGSFSSSSFVLVLDVAAWFFSPDAGNGGVRGATGGLFSLSPNGERAGGRGASALLSSTSYIRFACTFVTTDLAPLRQTTSIIMRLVVEPAANTRIESSEER